MEKNIYEKLLTLLLWLVALHSMLVGFGLILLPDSLMEFLGYGKCDERFFRSQGGVFHVAMAIGYALAAYKPKVYESLVVFSIIVKFIATLFLFSYTLFINPLPVIAFSGVSDFIMALTIFYLYKKNKKTGILDE